MFVLLLVSVTVLAVMPRPPAEASLGWDKLNHASAFFALGLSARWAWPASTWTRWWLGLLAYGVLLEGLQALTPTRQAEAWDVVADAVGLVAAQALVGVLTRLLRRRSAGPTLRATPPAPPR